MKVNGYEKALSEWQTGIPGRRTYVQVVQPVSPKGLNRLVGYQHSREA